MDPVARSSAWRIDPSFPIYHNDNEMVCGGPGTQWIFNSNSKLFLKLYLFICLN